MYKREKRSLVSGFPGHIATNYTRFVIVSKEVLPYEGNKMTLVIITEHVPGALYKALGYFYHSGMNMTHLESRPIPGSLLNTRFILT